MKRVLFLCTGNSCRSQMAEVILNKIGQGQFQAVSAGAKPAGYVHPLAIRLLQGLGFPTEELRSKSWDEFKGQAFDTVITVCDHAKESCPVWPGASVLHWSFEDPAHAEGTDEEKMKVFRKVFGEIREKVTAFTSGAIPAH
jgi:arsenate reductase (thioredoxin)